MKKCAILTMDQLDDFAVYDKHLDEPLANMGWISEHIPWRQTCVDWCDFDAVIIRSTWDYQDDFESFLKVLIDIEKSGAILLNPISIVKWNINKKYLKEVENKGVEIIPTIWEEEFKYKKIAGYFNYFNTDQMVIKPTISASSDNTFWLKKETYKSIENELNRCLINRQLMIQPFVPAIVEEGEYSLFYFAGDLSHCILKTPKKGDFRVQEEFGSKLLKIEASDELRKSGNSALQAIPEKCLYARIDLVKYQQSYKLMEIELIEPSLYFNLDDKAAERFSVAFSKWMERI